MFGAGIHEKRIVVDAETNCTLLNYVSTYCVLKAVSNSYLLSIVYRRYLSRNGHQPPASRTYLEMYKMLDVDLLGDHLRLENDLFQNCFQIAHNLCPSFLA